MIGSDGVPGEEMHVAAMTPAHAARIVTWCYPEPYACYDMTGAEPDTLLDPSSGYFALISGHELIGFRSFGPDGRVPGGSYDGSALDTGGGLRPDLTGRGLGRSAIETSLRFGRERFSPVAFRLTVASFNTRAQLVVGRLGFRRVGRFAASTDGREYDIFVRAERP